MEGEDDKSKQYIVPSPAPVGYAYVEPDKVIRCEAKGDFTDIFYTNGETAVCSKPLEYMEEFLKNSEFVRINDRHLINIQKISHYLDDDNGRYVFMTDGAKIKIAGSKKELLGKRIETL